MNPFLLTNFNYRLTEEDEGLASMVPILNSTYETVNSFLKPSSDIEIG